MIAHVAILDLAIGGFQEPEVVDAGERRQRRDQADVRAFGRLDRAYPAIMRRVNVPHLEPGAVAREAARPERGEAPLVSEFRQRVDLVHELRKLAPAKEVADNGRERLRVDEFLGRHGFDTLIEESHALFDEPLGAGQADAALVGQQLAHRAHAAAAEMINVIERSFAFLEAEQILRRGDQIGLSKDARVSALDAQFLVDLVAANPAQVVAFRIEKQAFDEGARVGCCGRIARPQSAVNVLEGFFLVLGGIFLHALDDDPLIRGRIHDLDLRDPAFGDLFHYRFGERLETARHNQTLLSVHGILDQDLVGQVFKLFGIFDV